jgi:hypothetical protein
LFVTPISHFIKFPALTNSMKHAIFNFAAILVAVLASSCQGSRAEALHASEHVVAIQTLHARIEYLEKQMHKCLCTHSDEPNTVSHAKFPQSVQETVFREAARNRLGKFEAADDANVGPKEVILECSETPKIKVQDLPDEARDANECMYVTLHERRWNAQLAAVPSSAAQRSSHRMQHRIYRVIHVIAPATSARLVLHCDADAASPFTESSDEADHGDVTVQADDAPN